MPPLNLEFKTPQPLCLFFLQDTDEISSYVSFKNLRFRIPRCLVRVSTEDSMLPTDHKLKRSLLAVRTLSPSKLPSPWCKLVLSKIPIFLSFRGWGRGYCNIHTLIRELGFLALIKR